MESTAPQQNEETSQGDDPALLEVSGLTVRFADGDQEVEAVRGIDFSLNSGEILALVGESGSGKSASALALTGLLPPPPRCRVGGRVEFNGRELMGREERELRRIRGSGIAYIFQEPSAAMNPVFTIGYQLREMIRLHRPGVADRDGLAIEVLAEVGIREPASRLKSFPSELSGGMLQRVMIAVALLGRPRLLVADEPTTALDATVQRQIIDLLARLREEHGMAILLITHNFGIIEGFADRVAVMYRGRIVETGETGRILREPHHPYTRALIDCIPRLGQEKERLVSIDAARMEAEIRQYESERTGT